MRIDSLSSRVRGERSGSGGEEEKRRVGKGGEGERRVGRARRDAEGSRLRGCGKRRRRDANI
jgi:hypothetical protein